MHIAFIGKMAAGKDFLASQLARAGVVRLSFSDPIHEFVRDHVLGRPYAKGEPGVREKLQTVGAAGRGDTPTPEWLMRIVRWLGLLGWGDKDFWVKRLERKMANLPEEADVVITDCRHDNEVAFAESNGFVLFGVACSEDTRRRRIAKRGETPAHHIEGHVSERLPQQMKSVVDPSHVIWNDTGPPPNDRYVSYDEFLRRVAAREL